MSNNKRDNEMDNKNLCNLTKGVCHSIQELCFFVFLRWGNRRRARHLPGVKRAGLLLWVLSRRLRMCSLDVCKDPVSSNHTCMMKHILRVAAEVLLTMLVDAFHRCMDQRYLSSNSPSPMHKTRSGCHLCSHGR